MTMQQFEGTTILSVRRGSQVAIGGDGQVTLGNVVIKATARKVRRLYQERILAGFAGGTADAFTLFERFEAKLEKHQGNLVRSAVELAKDWRTDRILRRRRAGAGIGHRRHRQRRRLCPGRGPRPAGAHRAGPRGHRPPVALHRRRHLHLHQPEFHHRDPGLNPHWFEM
jgi:hypothetical protein